MISEGYVSLWIGSAPSSKELEDYLNVRFSEDGDFITSKFGNDFGIDYYNDDFRELIFLETATTDLAFLLAGCSYDSVIIPRFLSLNNHPSLKAFNAAVLLYNFHWNGNQKIITNSSPSIEFLGVVSYS